ncbi:MAG: helix-turn-helix domain-containing protein [Candidatus Latescibacterota bacterium]
MTFEALLRRWLRSTNMSQADLARKSEMSTQQISKLIKRPTPPREKTIMQLATAFGVSFDEFMKGPRIESEEKKAVYQKTQEDTARLRIMQIAFELEGEDLTNLLHRVEGFFEGVEGKREQRGTFVAPVRTIK